MEAFKKVQYYEKGPCCSFALKMREALVSVPTCSSSSRASSLPTSLPGNYTATENSFSPIVPLKILKDDLKSDNHAPLQPKF